MSKLGVTPQDYEIEVEGYAGKIKLRRLTARQIEKAAALPEDEQKTLGLVALAALDSNGSPAYSFEKLDEIKDDLTSDLIVSIANAVVKSSRGKADSGN